LSHQLRFFAAPAGLRAGADAAGLEEAGGGEAGLGAAARLAVDRVALLARFLAGARFLARLLAGARFLARFVAGRRLPDAVRVAGRLALDFFFAARRLAGLRAARFGARLVVLRFAGRLALERLAGLRVVRFRVVRLAGMAFPSLAPWANGTNPAT